MKIVADQDIPYLQDYFAADFELVLKPGREMTAADLKTADILLVRSITKVDAALLDNTNIGFVGSLTAGSDHLDTAWLDANGIKWTTIKGFNAQAVADYVVSSIAALQRTKQLTMQPIKAAVIGCGEVGQLAVKQLEQLGYIVLQCDPYLADDLNFKHTPLAEIERADLVSLHLPYTTSGQYPTAQMINSAFLARQKAGCVLINTSRGGVVDTDAIWACGQQLTSCLDVWDHEPCVDPTLLMYVALATPHIAGYSVQSKMRGTQQIYRAVCDFVNRPSQEAPIPFPTQTLTFAGKDHHWQDIVLGIFNPVLMTTLMRSAILSSDNPGVQFDELRKQFTYRHEFQFTAIKVDSLLPYDLQILEKLGIKICFN